MSVKNRYGTARMYPKDGVKASGRISNSLGFIVCTKKIPYLSFGTKEYYVLSTGVYFTAVVTDPSDGQREPARAVELRPWAAWRLLATRKRGTERKHRRRQVGAPLAEEQNQLF